MSQTFLSKAAAVLFLLWGVLHVVGGGAILAALGAGPEAAFSFYRRSDAEFPALTGAILGYLAYALVWSVLPSRWRRAPSRGASL